MQMDIVTKNLQKYILSKDLAQRQIKIEKRNQCIIFDDDDDDDRGGGLVDPRIGPLYENLNTRTNKWVPY